jgi:F0F1-type ATP synthase delta subunit
METLKILIPIVVVSAAVLGLIVFIIKKLLLSDTMKAVGTIKQVEAEVRKKEETIRMEIDVHEKEFQKKKKEAEEELDAKRKTSEDEVGQMRETVIAEAQKEGDNILATAKRNEEQFKQQLVQEMGEKAVDYAGQVFEMVSSDSMSAELNKALIGELLDALDEVDSSSITVEGEGAEFTSSHAIDPEQKKRLEALLKDKFDVDMKVEEKIDESILGGLILKLGSLEIDGSLKNRYQEAVAEVKKTA